jgi:hypothetical protein
MDQVKPIISGEKVPNSKKLMLLNNKFYQSHKETYIS